MPDVEDAENCTRSEQNLTDGYMLPVLGIDECGNVGTPFILMHGCALFWIQLSTIGGGSVIIGSLFFNKTNKNRSFFKWQVSERLVVYLALCDFLFNISHTMDHAYYVSLQVKTSYVTLFVYHHILIYG